MKKIGVLTSGGDSPGMNAAVRAAVRCAIYKEAEIYGIYHGYEGLIDGKIEKMTTPSVGDILHRGGTILQTARSERFKTPEGSRKAYEMLQNFEIDSLIVVGGDGSMRGGCVLSDMGITVMGVPGTIDNDLAYTDYTIGFDTAVNTVLDAISKIRDTSSSHERTIIVEVMGRNCGQIAMHAGLTGGAESVLIPEVPGNLSEICRKIVQGRNRGKKHNIIVRAEGAAIGSQELAAAVAERTGVEVKTVILSYLQRGGSPTAFDRLLATRCGSKAVELILEGSDSKAIGIERNVIVACPLKEALELKREYDPAFLELTNILSI